ncbi:hypothetical protein TNCV_4929311 [Trichonephila clavipes]|nr:hypothetical protein TNCV_4929311 [Trichonephila clavipes]
MWSMVAQRLTQMTAPAATPDQLWQRVEAAWSAVPPEHIQTCWCMRANVMRTNANILLCRASMAGPSMKQKQQTKNKHTGSARARSDQWTMDIQKRLKSTLEGKINRIETFIESANEETDSVEIKVKLRSLIQLQKNVEELRNNYYVIPNVKDAELTAIDVYLHLLESALSL